MKPKQRASDTDDDEAPQCIGADKETAGFTVERLPGPPGGKREILRATKSD